MYHTYIYIYVIIDKHSLKKWLVCSSQMRLRHKGVLVSDAPETKQMSPARPPGPGSGRRPSRRRINQSRFGSLVAKSLH